MANLNDTTINGTLTVQGVEQPIITVGTKSAGFPSNPVPNQIHFMWDDTSAASEE